MQEKNKKTVKESKNKKKPRSKTATRKKADNTTKQVKALKEEIEKFQKNLNELNDKYLRTVAEFDNYKKRKDKEFFEIVDRANEQFCSSLLPVIDDFERSLNSDTKRKSYKSLKQGVDLIYQKLLTIFKQQGIEPIEAVGSPFDPRLHEAILQVADEGKQSNVVVEEVLKGYRLKDKVLRYSQVIVNK